VVLLSAHTPSKNPPPISGMEAYIAYLLGREILRRSPSSRSYVAGFLMCYRKFEEEDA
jgi:hypothetical protein